MHVEVKLMYMGKCMELPWGSTSCSFLFTPGGFWTVAPSVSFAPAQWASRGHDRLTVLHSNQVRFIQQPAGCSFGLHRAVQGPPPSIHAWDDAAFVGRWWPMPPLSVSSLAGPAWPGFPSEVWNQGSGAGPSGSTSWLLHSLPAHAYTHYIQLCVQSRTTSICCSISTAQIILFFF